jgi:hypothetical protein
VIGFMTDEIGAFARRSEMYRQPKVQFFRDATSASEFESVGWSTDGALWSRRAVEAGARLHARGYLVQPERKLRLPVQSGARRDGNAGIDGNPGNVESVTYRI